MALSHWGNCSGGSYSVFIRHCPLTEMAGFTPFFPQFLAIQPFAFAQFGASPSLNQPSLCPLPLAFSRSSLVALAFSCHLLQDLGQLSKHYHHPYSTYVRTIQYSIGFLLTHLQFSSTARMFICSSVVFFVHNFPSAHGSQQSSFLSP